MYDTRFSENDYYFVQLKEERTGKIIEKKLFIDKSYPYIKNPEQEIKIETAFPHALRPNYYLILFDQDERKTMIDLISDLSGMEEEIDYYLIETWKEKIANFYNQNFNTYKEFYENYRELLNQKGISPRTYGEFKDWIKGSHNYTQIPDDLYYIGQIMADTFFMENYKAIHEEGKKIQVLHLQISKKMNNIIKQILEGNLEIKNLSLEEFEIYERIENSIYIIQDIKKIKTGAN